MAVIETWFNQDLQKPVKVQYIDGSMFSNNGNGNRIGVNVYDNGEPVTLTGSVSGYAVLSDGTTVPCTGERTNNKASIIVPPAAYVPGALFLSVFLTDGTTVTTLAAVSTSVLLARTDSQVDLGTVVADWTQTINGAMQDVQTAAENLGQIVATPYARLTYPVPLGKYTYNNGNLYRCVSPIASSENFTPAHWSAAINLGDEVSNLKSAFGSSLENDLKKDIVETAQLRNYRDDEYVSSNKHICTDEFTLDRYYRVEIGSDYRIGWFILREGEASTTSGWKSAITFAPGIRYIIIIKRTDNGVIDLYDAIDSIRIYKGGVVETAESGALLSSFTADGLYDILAAAVSVYSDKPTGIQNDCLLTVERFESASNAVYIRQTIAENTTGSIWYRIISASGTTSVDWTVISEDDSILVRTIQETSAIVYPNQNCLVTIDTTAETITLDGLIYIKLFNQSSIQSHTPTGYIFLRNPTSAVFIFYDMTAEKVVVGNGNDINTYHNTNPANICIYLGVYDPTRTNLSYCRIPMAINGVRLPINPSERKLYKKTFSIMGDSVSTFVGYIPEGYATWYDGTNAGVESYRDTYWGKLMWNHGMQLLVNDSWSGSALCFETGKEDAYMAGVARVNALGNVAPDYMFILAGGNDVNRTLPLGEFTPTLVDLSTVTDDDARNFADAYKIMITRIKTKFPRTRLVILWYHNISSAPNSTHGGVNYGIQDQYANVAEAVATFYGAQFIDLRKCGLDMFNNATLDIRNHPTKEGMEMYYNYIIQNLVI